MSHLKQKIYHFLHPRKRLLKWAAWFFAGNVLLSWLIGISYLIDIVPIPLNENTFVNELLAWGLLLTGFIGQLTLLTLLPAILIVLPLIFFCYRQRKIVFFTAIISATCTVIFLFIDTVIFKQFHFHLNGVILELVTHKAAGQIFDFSWLEYFILFVVLLGCLGIETCYTVYVWRKLILRLSSRIVLHFFSATLGCLFFSYYLFFQAGIHPWLALNKQMLALPLYENFLSTITPATENNLAYMSTLGNGHFVQLDYPNKKLHYPLHPLNCKATPKPLNIVVIVIDTWRFDMLNSSVTPNLTNFAQANWQFTQHFSGGNGTRPGIFSLFYGLPANYWTAMTEQKSGPVLFNELLHQHYEMGIFASATLSMPAFNLNVFSSIKNLQLLTAGNNAFQRDQNITRQFQKFVAQVSKNKTPFFSFVFYDGAHSFCEDSPIAERFKPAVKVCNRWHPKNLEIYFNRYKNSLYHIDQLIAQDLAALRRLNLLENTIIIVTGDHGEEFDDNHLNYAGHAGNFTHYQVQTPLIIHWPQKLAAEYNYKTSHYDIAPTLLTHALGCQNPIHDYSIGYSLFSPYDLPYLLVHSYMNFGIIEPDRITTVLPTGNYQIDNLNGQPLPNAQLHLDILKQAFETMRRYYSP